MNNQEQQGLFDLGFVNRINQSSTELPITNREREVITRIAQGKTNRQISQELILSPSTVRNHISSIFNKLRISNRSQATAIAIYSGLLTAENFMEKTLPQTSDSK